MTLQELPALPQWLQDITPTPREPLVIEYQEPNFVLSHSTLKTEVFPTLENAFHVGLHEYAAYYTETIGGIVIKGSIPVQYSSVHNLFVTSKKSGTLMMFQDDYSSYETLQRAYARWLIMYEQYVEDPENFTNAYFFVDMHPVFWIRRSPHPSDHEMKPFLWHTHQYVSERLIHGIFFVNEHHLHTLEAGSHVPDNFVDHYHDTDLDVQEETYEQALIALAHQIHQKFNFDGSLRDPDNAPSLPIVPDFPPQSSTEDFRDFMQLHEKNAVNKKILDTLKTLANSYPMTRDMVSRTSVKDWLYDNIEKLEKEFNETP